MGRNITPLLRFVSSQTLYCCRLVLFSKLRLSIVSSFVLIYRDSLVQIYHLPIRTMSQVCSVLLHFHICGMGAGYFVFVVERMGSLYGTLRLFLGFFRGCQRVPMTLLLWGNF